MTRPVLPRPALPIVESHGCCDSGSLLAVGCADEEDAATRGVVDEDCDRPTPAAQLVEPSSFILTVSMLSESQLLPSVETATLLLLLVKELESAEFLVVIDGVSELVSERIASKLGTDRIVFGSILGVPYSGVVATRLGDDTKYEEPGDSFPDEEDMLWEKEFE
jgi:hypothetical protein